MSKPIDSSVCNMNHVQFYCAKSLICIYDKALASALTIKFPTIEIEPSHVTNIITSVEITDNKCACIYYQDFNNKTLQHVYIHVDTQICIIHLLLCL